MWTLELPSAKAEFVDLIEAGLPSGAERPQSMLLVPNRAVYIGGHFSMDVRDLRTGEHRRFRVPGRAQGPWSGAATRSTRPSTPAARSSPST
ncbi:hypothetical protein [Nonomuraea dietziae]|uniref:hypothetical protein n=1 Tax=Nonomuraea dietziae TaxID=65515 RepID=UPI0031D45BE5